MNLKKWFCALALSTQLIGVLTEFITLGVTIGAGLAAAGTYFGFCRFQECCNEDYVPFSIYDLTVSLNSHLFGQPLALEIIPILQGHKESLDRKSSQKALGISFHGWPGTGKTFLVSLIAKALYKKGMESQYFKFYSAKDFIDPNLTNVYKAKLMNEIQSVTKSCEQALFVFDEVQDIPMNILNAVKPFLDYHHIVNGVDYRKAIFIFLSNVNGDEITRQFYNLKISRDTMRISDFENILKKNAYENNGGFQGSTLIYSHVIDYYIPFLPLEQRHVEKCIEVEMKSLNMTVTKEATDFVLSMLTFGPGENPIYAVGGCKRIRKIVSYSKFKHDKT